MGIIDNFFTNHDLIIKGFNAIKGDVKYIVAKDRGGNILLRIMELVLMM